MHCTQDSRYIYIWLVQIVINCQCLSYPLVFFFLAVVTWIKISHISCVVSLLEKHSSFSCFHFHFPFSLCSPMTKTTELKLHPDIMFPLKFAGLAPFFRWQVLAVTDVGSLLQGRWGCIFCLGEVVTPEIWVLTISPFFAIIILNCHAFSLYTITCYTHIVFQVHLR